MASSWHPHSTSHHGGEPQHVTAQIWSTGTAGQGATPCSLILTSAGGGSASIVDASGKTVFTTAGTAVPVQSSVPAGGALAQGAKLYSPNGLYFLTVQGDGNTVLYSTSLCAWVLTCNRG